MSTFLLILTSHQHIITCKTLARDTSNKIVRLIRVYEFFANHCRITSMKAVNTTIYINIRILASPNLYL